MRLLLVDDEKRLTDLLKGGLAGEGFAVDVAHDGSEGLWLATENAYDVIVLDVMLPRLNGYRVCARIREAQNWTPILMLTAKDGEYDEAEALDTGADDYLAKPFSFVVVSKQELLAQAWDFAFDGDPNIVEVYISALRRKIDAPFGRSSLVTVRGAGYRLGD